MNAGQSLFVQKTLGWVGTAFISIWAFLVILLSVRLISVDVGISTIFKMIITMLFDPADGAPLIIWPLLAIGLIAFWVKAYLKSAGTAQTAE
ncbi:hypothetical protein KC131_24830 [Pseudomonas sp. JQ170]|uniref:hypothetical protein n=1 Tax=unclassified Pseudomonas TaxID=196821 RepID=UPI00264CDDF0|nr:MULTISPECIES: hypothetical protein [unclassified Pseudomonas]MDN7143874.1 hypothetical protein [Pseudomonas sp. JQ170]WRO74228.1 hypothetical protein U9R80_17060 [Pseudomonas sp. 170C]